MHLRVFRWKTNRAGVISDFRDTYASTGPHHFPNQPIADRLMRDALDLLIFHTKGKECLEPTLAIRDSQGCIASIGELACSLYNAAENTVKR